MSRRADWTHETNIPSCDGFTDSIGQSTFGDLRGTTRDPSGLPLTQAAVTVHNVEANNDRTLVSATTAPLRLKIFGLGITNRAVVAAD
jgi:hypothetical protein